MPQALRAVPGWLLWRYGPAKANGRRDKVPHYIDGRKRTGEEGSAADVARLATFADAVAACEAGGFAGIGLAMLSRWNIVALDLDRKSGKEAEHLSDAEMAELTAGTYAERSPSGLGVRAFFVGQMPNIKGGEHGVEVFCSRQFVTVTGNALPGSPATIAALTHAMRAKLETFRKGPAKPDGGDDGGGPKPRMHLTLDQARGLLNALPVEWFTDYVDRWLGVCMACHHEGSGAPEWLALLHEVSRERCPAKYDAAVVDAKWRSFGDKPGALRMWSLAEHARANGWVQPPLHEAAAQEFGPVPEQSTPQPGQRELVIVGADEVEIQNVRWLWPHRLPRKFLSVFAADGGSGKSTVTATIAATLTTGAPWPDDSEVLARHRRDPCRVLWLGVEDPLAEVTVPRLHAAGAVMNMVKFITGIRRVGADGTELFSLQDDLGLLRATLRSMRSAGQEVGLVVVDPVTSYLHGKRKVNPYVATELRSVLQPFADLCNEEDLALICITHLTKDKSRGFIDSVMGSGALTQLSRNVWGFARVPEEDDGAHVMFYGKGNLGSAGISIRYAIRPAEVIKPDGEVVETAKVVWGPEDRTLTQHSLVGGSRGPVPFARQEIAAWLREYLGDGAWHLADQVRQAAIAAGFKEASVRRTTDDLVERERWNGVWMWALPKAKKT